MQLNDRRAAALLAAAALICFGSCERHKPEELHHGEHAAGNAAEHPAHDAGTPGHDAHATEDAHAHASATPAQFFPSAAPTP